jgi:hypothetical protein
MRWTWFEAPLFTAYMFVWVIVSRPFHFHIYYLFVVSANKICYVLIVTVALEDVVKDSLNWKSLCFSFKSQFVSQSLYVSNWPDLSPSMRRLLLIFMIRLSKPIQIFAAKIVPITLQSYIAVSTIFYVNIFIV